MTSLCLLAGIVPLAAAIEDYIQQHNQQPRPFVWTT